MIVLFRIELIVPAVADFEIGFGTGTVVQVVVFVVVGGIGQMARAYVALRAGEGGALALGAIGSRSQRAAGGTVDLGMVAVGARGSTGACRGRTNEGL